MQNTQFIYAERQEVMNVKARVIAFYLPQYHPFKENDDWWGKGFTEWTNVGKAKPLFRGHYQPKVPADLGYYDLRLPIVREQQAELAREAGVEGFCYWHYWFAGHRLMPEVFDEVLSSGKPDFPFCLGWANHSWYAKNWNADGTTVNRILIEQNYPGINDARAHFKFLVKAFKDDRYIKVDGKPFFFIYDPRSLPTDYIENFRKWSKEEGFPDLYIVANLNRFERDNKDYFIKNGYDAVQFSRLGGVDKPWLKKMGKAGRAINKIYCIVRGFILHRPKYETDYKKFYHYLIDIKADSEENTIPVLVPNWDHTPRSGRNGSLFVDASPEYFYLHAKEMMNLLAKKNNKIVMLKSWNEWAEGNYMEPDLRYGHGFINALRKAINEG